jgi:tubulin gamma
MTCFGHCGIGLGAESYRRLLLDVGADPLKPILKDSKDESRILKRYGSTILRFPGAYTGGEAPLIPRALLVDLDPRAANLILQSYPDLFALRDKHVIHGAGGAARNWAEGRSRFKNEVTQKWDFTKQLSALSPEPVRGYTVPFAMGGGTGSSFACSFIRSNIKEHATIATLGLLPEFGWDPVIFEAAAINIVMNLEYQIKYSDCSILFSNKRLRELSHKYEKRVQKIPSIIDDLPKEHEVGWKDYKGMNLIAANAISMFISSFARETEWDMSNYRTWLATKRPKMAIPWAIPVLPEEDQWNLNQIPGMNKNNTMDAIIENLNKKQDALLFDIDENDVRNYGGPRDSCCALVKVKGDFDVKERETLKRVIKDRFNIEDSRMIFVKIPIMEREQANVTILVNTKAIGPKILEIAREAEESWDAYKDEYGKWGLTTEDFKQSLMDVVHQFS